VHLRAGLQGAAQGRIVMRTQVAPKPHQASRVS
jgi:hypothetical protein